MESQITNHEGRLSRIEGLLEDLNKRLDEGVFSQIRDHGKRIREIEASLGRMAESCAVERGKSEGSRAVFMAVIAAVSSFGGLIGSFASRLF